jgi:hypothetical protein
MASESECRLRNICPCELETENGAQKPSAVLSASLRYLYRDPERERQPNIGGGDVM